MSYFTALIIQARKRDPKSGDTTNGLEYFQKPWSDYKNGFGDINSDFWLGLESLNNLTSTENTNWRLEVSKSYFQGSIERIFFCETLLAYMKGRNYEFLTS